MPPTASQLDGQWHREWMDVGLRRLTNGDFTLVLPATAPRCHLAGCLCSSKASAEMLKRSRPSRCLPIPQHVCIQGILAECLHSRRKHRHLGHLLVIDCLLDTQLGTDGSGQLLVHHFRAQRHRHGSAQQNSIQHASRTASVKFNMRVPWPSCFSKVMPPGTKLGLSDSSTLFVSRGVERGHACSYEWARLFHLDSWMVCHQC